MPLKLLCHLSLCHPLSDSCLSGGQWPHPLHTPTTMTLSLPLVQNQQSQGMNPNLYNHELRCIFSFTELTLSALVVEEADWRDRANFTLEAPKAAV